MAKTIKKDGTVGTTKTVYETGHGKNVANFSTLLKVVSSMGNYQPSNNLITIGSLQQKEKAVNTMMEQWVQADRLYANTNNTRNQVFDKLKPYATRLLATLASSQSVDKRTLADAKSYNKKIQGQRITKKETPDAINPNQPQTRTISTSQQSFDLKVEHYKKLRILLESVPTYTPNEKDLNIDAVRQYEKELSEANEKADTNENELLNTRNARNTQLYDELTGVVALSKVIKQYIKGVMGATSPDYKKITALQFKKTSDKAAQLK